MQPFSLAALARLKAEGEQAFDMLQNVTLNWSVIFSLFLTIFVTLAVMHAGSAPYEPDSSARPSFAADSEEGASFGAWLDLATYLRPEDAEAQSYLRRAFYVCECAFVGFGVFACLLGLNIAMNMYTFVGSALPDALSKLEFVLANRTSFGMLWTLFDLAEMVMPPAVGFVAARASAVMSLSIFVAGVAKLLHFIWMATAGPPASGHLIMWADANRILRAQPAERVLERVPTASTSTAATIMPAVESEMHS